VLQCVAVCCSVLQCVAVCCSVLNGVENRFHSMLLATLQCVAVCCSVLQFVEQCGIPFSQHVTSRAASPGLRLRKKILRGSSWADDMGSMRDTCYIYVYISPYVHDNLLATDMRETYHIYTCMYVFVHIYRYIYIYI